MQNASRRPADGHRSVLLSKPQNLPVRRLVYIRDGYNRRVNNDRDRRPRPESLLPLAPAAFHILVALAEEDRHGYAIMEHVAKSTRGVVKLAAGTLYRTIQRLLEQGLIVETRQRPSPEEDRPS